MDDDDAVAVAPDVMTGTVVLSEVGLVLAGIGLAWAFDVSWGTWSVGAEALALGVFGAMPTVVAMRAYQGSTWPPAVRLNRLVEEELKPLFAGCRMPHFLVIGAAAGLGEEFLFRGVLQELGAGLVGAPLAMVLVSLLFAAAHAMSREYFVAALIMGLWWGGLALLTGNLVVVALAHALHDVVALWMLVDE